MSEPKPTDEQREAAGGWLADSGVTLASGGWRLEETSLANWLASREAAAKAGGMRAVLKYAQHLFDCEAALGMPLERACSCGLDALRKEAGE